ncbi:MAG: RimK family alpha-L-glutamate ligase, partial [Myxococcales bacterium]|nr:RimK family alpha-L-glutamate ligase [Myxococcales bacterium]
GCAVLRQFEVGGTYSVNESIAITRSRDKLRSMQLLSRRGVGLPVTAFGSSTQDVDGLIEAVGGPPLIVKVTEGTQGMGVVLAETRKSAEAVIQAFQGLNANFLVQEYIKESAGTDLRCFVINDRVVAAMQRRAAEGDFRANVHRGGKVEKVRLTPEERQIAVRAAKAMGLKVSGVDLLRSNHGAVVLEVNSSPGLEGIETATGKDVAGAVIDYVAKNQHTGAKADRLAL